MFEFLGLLNLEKHTSSLCSNAVASSIIDNNQDIETTSTNDDVCDVVSLRSLKTGAPDPAKIENGIKPGVASVPQLHVTPHLVPVKQGLPAAVPHQVEKQSLHPELLKTPMPLPDPGKSPVPSPVPELLKTPAPVPEPLKTPAPVPEMLKTPYPVPPPVPEPLKTPAPVPDPLKIPPPSPGPTSLVPDKQIPLEYDVPQPVPQTRKDWEVCK